MRAIDASKNGFADPAWDTPNPLISPENSSPQARGGPHWARTRPGSVSTAFQHATLGSRQPPLRLDAAVNHRDDQVAAAMPETISPILRSMTSPHAFAGRIAPDRRASFLSWALSFKGGAGRSGHPPTP